MQDPRHGARIIARAIETSLDVEVPDHAAQPRLLFKNAPWNTIKERINKALRYRPARGDVQEQADRLTQVVLEAVNTLTPKVKPSPYEKRWWARDLTKLRQVYTYWRNRARAQRRGGETLPELEQQARAAAKEYHDATRKQQRLHRTSSWRKTPISGRPTTTSNQTMGRDDQGFHLWKRPTGEQRGTTRSRPSSCLLHFFQHCPKT